MAKFLQIDPILQPTLEAVLAETWAEFPRLAQNQIALTWVLYDPPNSIHTGGALNPEAFWQMHPRSASYRGVELIYPASVVKLFYLVAMHEWLDRGMTQTSPEIERAMKDMIVDSSNDATGYIVDCLTGTTSGPELPDGPFETWKHQRNLVNRYLQTLQWPELATINVNQKTWGDGPYGREKAFLGETLENRNMLTTEATARLVHSIVGGVAINPERSKAMMSLMKRDRNPDTLAADPENQVTGFIGAALPLSARVWSKAGWTSRVRHDAAYIEAEGCHPYQLVIFTEGQSQSQNEAILPFVSEKIYQAVKSLTEV
jgi:Beta-lactamase enzyme family